MKLRIVLAIVVVIMAISAGIPACATLGGDMGSVHDDQMKMQGSLRTTSANFYNIHEIQSASGVTVREYVSLSGNVFGVAWQGRTHPDLHQVLGPYYDRFVQAAQAQRAQRHGHGPLLIQGPGLTLEIGGHMGALFGRAFLPQNMPAGMRAEEIR